MEAPEHTYEVTAGWAMVYTQATTFSQNLRRVTRGMRMKGREIVGAGKGPSWVELAEGGFILLSRLRIVDMNDAAWMVYLGSLTPRERYVIQGAMARMARMLNSDRILEIEDFQHLEDSAMNQQRQITADELRQDDADARMDRDETDIHALADRLTELEHPQ